MEGRMAGWRGHDSESDLLCRACVESNLNTRMIVIAPVSTTAAHFKERIRHCHLQNFPEHGNVRIRKLSVRVSDQYYTFNEGPIGVICQGTDARLKVEMEVAEEKLEQNLEGGAANRLETLAFCGTCQKYSSSQNIECGKTPLLARVVLDSPEFVTPRGVEESRHHSQAKEKEKNEDDGARSKSAESEASLSKERARASENSPSKGAGSKEKPGGEPSPSKAPNEPEKQKAMEVEAPGKENSNRERNPGSDEDETTIAGSKPAVSQPGSTGAKRSPESRRSSEAQAPKSVVIPEPSLSQTRKRKAGEAGSPEAPGKVARVESQEVSEKLDTGAGEVKQTEAKQVEALGLESEDEAGEANNLHANNVENSVSSESSEKAEPGCEKKKPGEEVNKEQLDTTAATVDDEGTPRSTNSSRPLDLCTSKNADDLCDKLITQHFSDSSISKIAGNFTGGFVTVAKCQLNRMFSEDLRPRETRSSSSEESGLPAPQSVVAAPRPLEIPRPASPVASADDDVEESDSESSEEAPNAKYKVGLIVPNTVDSEEVHEGPSRKQVSSDSASSKSVSSKSKKDQQASKQAEVSKRTTTSAQAEAPKKTTTVAQSEGPNKTSAATRAEAPKKNTSTVTQAEAPKKTITTSTQADAPKKNTTIPTQAEAPKKTTTTSTPQQQVQSKQARAKKPAIQTQSSSSSESDSESSSSTDESPSPSPTKKNPGRVSGVEARFQHLVQGNDLQQMIMNRSLKRREEEVVPETQDIEAANKSQDAGKGDLQKNDETPKQKQHEGSETIPKEKGDKQKDDETPKQRGDDAETPKLNADEELKGMRYKQKAGRNKTKSKGAQQASKAIKQSPVVAEAGATARKRKAPENTEDAAGAAATQPTTTTTRGKAKSQKKQKNTRAASPPLFQQGGYLISPPLAVITASGRRLKGEQSPCPICGKCYSGRHRSFYSHRKQCLADAAAAEAANN